MKNGFSGDLTSTFEGFQKMTGEEMTKALAKGLRKAAKEVVNLTKSNATSGMLKRNNPHWYDGELVTYNDKIEDAARHGRVWIGGYSGVADEMTINVSVFGSRASDSGTYRFRFLELGTKERFAKYYRKKKKGQKGKGERALLKKPRRLGRITPKWWFRNAYQAVVPNVDNIILTEVEQAINKINANNGK